MAFWDFNLQWLSFTLITVASDFCMFWYVIMLCGVGLELHHCFTKVCRKMRLRGGLECKLMFYVGIVHINLYNCIA